MSNVTTLYLFCFLTAQTPSQGHNKAEGKANMRGTRRCSLFFLVAFCANLTLGTGHVSKTGCQGDSIELCHISFDNTFTLVSFYKGNALIAMWSMQNSILNTTLSNGYNNKIFLDINGNVHIRKLHISDEAKYIIKIEKRNESYDCEVQLVILVAPSTNCKPKIKRVDDVLTVHLEAKDCGKPVPSVYWLSQPGTFLEETKAIKLLPGKQAGTYYACIEGEGLTCANSSKLSNYCSYLVVDEGQSSSGHEGAGKLINHTLQENPSTGQEGAGNIGNNSAKGIDLNQSSMTSEILLTIVIILLALTCIAIIMYVVYRFVTWKKLVPMMPEEEMSDDIMLRNAV